MMMKFPSRSISTGLPMRGQREKGHQNLPIYTGMGISINTSEALFFSTLMEI
jgi:hypothetical protein